MTKSFCHFDTIPSNIMDSIESHLSENFDSQMDTSRLMGGAKKIESRNSQNAWVPTTNWIGGLMWYYYKRANDEFFHYDLECIDGESMQYTQYAIDQKYDWHQDEGVSGLYKPQASGNRDTQVVAQDFMNMKSEKIRKLSAVVQLVDGDDYEGGGTEILDVDGTLYTVPRERGTIVFFDSRLKHRACTVKKGMRKSLITWAVGPRWN
jgi:PKHD-type hydroxylase